MISVSGCDEKLRYGPDALPRQDSSGRARFIVQNLTFAAIVVWLVLVAGSGFWISQKSVTDELARLAASAEHEARTSAQIVDRLFIEMTSVANMVARQGDVHALANRYLYDPPGFERLTREERARVFTSDALTRRVGDYMTGLADDLQFARIYLNNLSFDTVISSHWTDEFNIVGQIYTGRAYLMEALEGGRGQMFGIARLNQMPSYFVASRIENPDEEPIGAVTVRLDAPQIEQYLTGSHIALVVNEQGRVTTSSHPDFMLRNVGALFPTKPVQNPDKDEGPGEALDIVPVSGAAENDRWIVDDHPYLVRSQTLVDAQYQLVILVSLEHLQPMQQRNVVLGALLAVVGVVMILLCGGIAGQRAIRRQEERFAANNDFLTGLPNRRQVLQELERFFDCAKQSKQYVLVAFIDLDGFKAINDNFGHGVGDRFLVEISHRLSRALRQGDLLGRWGGDEFIVIGLSSSPSVEEPGRAEKMMRSRLAQCLVGTYDLDGRAIEYSGASVGVVGVDPKQNSPQATLIQADKLMYTDKEARRRRQVQPAA